MSSAQSTPEQRRVFSQNLRIFMDRRGIGNADLARKTGLTKNAISSYKRAISLPHGSKLQAIADALDVPVVDLLRKDPSARGDGMSGVESVRDLTAYEIYFLITFRLLPESIQHSLVLHMKEVLRNLQLGRNNR